MSFSSDLAKFADKARIRMDQVVRKVTIDLTRDLVRATPVDSGLARNSYFFGQTRNATVGTVASKNGSASNQRAAEFASNLKAGGVFFITNNLPYIMVLEYGRVEGKPSRGSIQAPHGMARITVDRWQERVNKIVRAL